MTITGGRVNEVSSSTGVKVKETSTELIGANAARGGLQIINTGQIPVFLKLGGAAEASKGVWLAAEGGAWDGTVGPLLWAGSVFGITTSGESLVVLTEV